MLTRTAFVALVVAAALCGAAADQCPQQSFEGHSIVGDWEGYLLSSVGAMSNSATARMSFTLNPDNSLRATMNLTNPSCYGSACKTGASRGPPRPARRRPAHAPRAEPPITDACIVDLEVVCLDPEHPTVYGFKLPAKRPACFGDSSPWRCNYYLTSADYQDSGHPAAFFFTVRWDDTVSQGQLRMSPFGTFPTGCPAVEVSLQARLTPVDSSA